MKNFRLIFLMILVAQIFVHPPAMAGNGPVDSANQFSYVVLLRIQTAKGWGNCSGTALDERTILTAGHCIYREGKLLTNIRVYDRGFPNSPDAHYVVAASTSLPKPYVHAVDEILFHGEAFDYFDGDTDTERRYTYNSQDMAVIHLREPLELKEYARTIFSLIPQNELYAYSLIKKWTTYLSPMDLGLIQYNLMSHFPFDRNVRFGIHPKRVVSVGYGLHSIAPGDQCAINDGIGHCIDYQRRYNDDKIDDARTMLTASGFGLGTSWSVESAATGESSEMQGDSGGPLLFQANDGRYYVAGVDSGSVSGLSYFSSMLHNFNFYYRAMFPNKSFERAPIVQALGLQLENIPGGGVKVIAVDEYSVAGRANIFIGDVLPGGTVENLNAKLEELYADDKINVNLKIKRGGKTISQELDLGYLE